MENRGTFGHGTFEYVRFNESTGRVSVLPRGGSDITGALVAQAIHAKVYENWTDVNGVCVH